MSNRRCLKIEIRRNGVFILQQMGAWGSALAPACPLHPLAPWRAASCATRSPFGAILALKLMVKLDTGADSCLELKKRRILELKAQNLKIKKITRASKIHLGNPT